MSASASAPSSSAKVRKPIMLPRLGSAALALLGSATAFWFAGWILGLILTLVIFVSGVFAHMESIRAFRRASAQVKRDWATQKWGAVTGHMGWYVQGNRRLDASDANREPETTRTWWLAVVFVCGFGPLVVTMLTAPLLPFWSGLVLTAVLAGLYLYAIRRMVKYGNPATSATPPATGSATTA